MDELQKHLGIARDFLKLEGCLYSFNVLLFCPVEGVALPVALLAPSSDT